MNSPNGYFEAYVNQLAEQPGPQQRHLIRQVAEAVRTVCPKAQVHWAGSQRKRTAIMGSDLDLCIKTPDPVSEATRRQLRRELEFALERPAVVCRHVIRLPAIGTSSKVDIAFAHATFGSRPLPDPTPFHNNRTRQTAVRALKIWTRASNLRFFSGWAVEATVLHLDATSRSLLSLELFQRVVDWLADRANPKAVEAILRPAAHPSWNPQWSKRLPGRIQAVANQARSLRRRHPQPASWAGPEDVGCWLTGS